jgi:hypothetical protein
MAHDCLMANADLLIHKIARARRFADAVSSDADRGMFKAMAAELQRELDATRADPKAAGHGQRGEIVALPAS